jgi:predicted acyl esterase
MWDHVRGNETDPSTGRLKEGRAGWFDEVMRFYDQYLKGIKPKVQDPPIAVQTSDGSWRAEQRWPPADAKNFTSALKPGDYTDNGLNNGTNQGYPENGDGVWTFSKPSGHDVHLAGVPSVTLDVATQAPSANLVVDVYDVDQSDNATLISRGAYLVPQSGKITYGLYGDDWIVKKNHRVGVLVTSSNSEWWAHVPTGQDVSVKSASITLPFLTCARTRTIEGDPSVKLESYLKSAPFAVDPATVAGQADPAFSLPGAARNCSAKKVRHSAKKRAKRRKHR